MTSAFIAITIAVQLSAQQGQERKGEHHRYKVVDLGTLGGPASFIPNPWSQDVDRRGTVIAEADTLTLDPNSPNCFQPDCLVNHAIKWHEGVRTDLGALPGTSSSFPAWVNERGLITGFSENGLIDPLTGFPEVVAVLWKDEKISELGTFGGNASYANATNNRDQIVGGALNTTLDPYASGFWRGFTFFPVATELRAFLWQDGVMHDLGTLGGPDSAALFLNERGQVAGASYTNSSPNATTGNPTQDPFLWVPCDRDHLESNGYENDPQAANEKNGKMLDLGSLGGTYGYPNWLNNQGQVVGQSNLKGDNEAHPFLSDGKLMKDLGTLGGKYGAAYSVNDAGQIVGFANLRGDHVGHAFLWKDGVYAAE